MSYQGSLDYKPDQAHTHLRAVQLSSSLHFWTVRGHRQPEAGPARLIILVLLLSTQSPAISTQHDFQVSEALAQCRGGPATLWTPWERGILGAASVFLQTQCDVTDSFQRHKIRYS